MPGQARLPTRHSTRHAPRPVRYSAQAVFRHKYAHHIAALATTPIAGKQASLSKLLRGPDAATWARSNANEWGRLLEFGIGKDRPLSKRITGTGTIFFIQKQMSHPIATSTMQTMFAIFALKKRKLTVSA